MSKSAGQRPRFSEGPEDARVMLIGQNPGREEERQSRPFVGRAGKYLSKVLLKKGIDRSQLYLTSVVKESTPANRKPTANEIKRWMPCLMREIREIDPQIVVLMGRVAWETPRIAGIEYMETYHPAAAMRFLKVGQRFEKDMGMLRRKMKNRSLL